MKDTAMFEIFHYDFLMRGLAAALTVAVMAPTIGMFLVVRRQAFLADTLAHVSLAGVAAGLLFAFNPVVGAIGASVLAAFMIEKLRLKKGFYGESALSLMLSGSLALAVVMIGLAKGLSASLFSYLFGSVTTVSRLDLVVIMALGVAVIIIVLINFRQFFLVSLDEELALSGGLPAQGYNLLLTVLAGLAIALSLRIVGALLVGALMVIPVLAASRFDLGFRKTHLLAVVLSIFSVIIGFFLSYSLDLAAGGTIVGVAILIFVASLLFGRK
jgi:zinc transport system permease protein